MEPFWALNRELRHRVASSRKVANGQKLTLSLIYLIKKESGPKLTRGRPWNHVNRRVGMGQAWA